MLPFFLRAVVLQQCLRCMLKTHTCTARAFRPFHHLRQRSALPYAPVALAPRRRAMPATRRRWKISALPAARRRQWHQELFANDEIMRLVSWYLGDEDQRDAKTLAQQIILPMRSAKFVNKLPRRRDSLMQRLRFIEVRNVMDPLPWQPSVETMALSHSRMPSLQEPWVSLKELIIEQPKYDFIIDPRDFPNLEKLILNECANFIGDVRHLTHLRNLIITDCDKFTGQINHLDKLVSLFLGGTPMFSTDIMRLPHLQSLVILENDNFNGRLRDLPSLRLLVVHSAVFNQPLDEFFELGCLEIVSARFDATIGPKTKLERLDVTSVNFNQPLPSLPACAEFLIVSEAFNQSIPEMPCLLRFHLSSPEFNRPIRLLDGLLNLTLDAPLFDGALEFPDTVEYVELLTKDERYRGHLRLLRRRAL